VFTRFLLLRHGQSTWNAEKRWQGQADPPLTELGEEQAWQAAQQLGMFDVLVASDLTRARDTATIIGNHLGVGPVVLDERLRENFAGEWQGLTRDEIDAGWPGWVDAGRMAPSFETIESSTTRSLASLLEHARANPGADVLVVTHGGIIRMLRRLLELSENVDLPNLAGMWFQVRADPSPDIVPGEMVTLLASHSAERDRDAGRRV
jgi:broad specificity phosphatase PhoE